MSEWSIKLGLSALLTAACAFSGRAFCLKLQRRAALLSELFTVLRPLRIAMLERLMPLPDALRETEHISWIAIANSINDGMGVRSAWQQYRDEQLQPGHALDCLTDADLRLLDLFFDQLGQSGLIEQAVLMDIAETGMKRQLDEAQAQFHEQSKLYSNLGLLLGLGISICLM